MPWNGPASLLLVFPVRETHGGSMGRKNLRRALFSELPWSAAGFLGHLERLGVLLGVAEKEENGNKVVSLLKMSGASLCRVCSSVCILQCPQEVCQHVWCAVPSRGQPEKQFPLPPNKEPAFSSRRHTPRGQLPARTPTGAILRAQAGWVSRLDCQRAVQG